MENPSSFSPRQNDQIYKTQQSAGKHGEKHDDRRVLRLEVGAGKNSKKSKS
jgi:hypothetical protein